MVLECLLMRPEFELCQVHFNPALFSGGWRARQIVYRRSGWRSRLPVALGDAARGSQLLPDVGGCGRLKWRPSALS